MDVKSKTSLKRLILLNKEKIFLSFVDKHLNEKTIVGPLFNEGQKFLDFWNVKEGMAVIEPLDILKSSESLGNTKHNIIIKFI